LPESEDGSDCKSERRTGHVEDHVVHVGRPVCVAEVGRHGELAKLDRGRQDHGDHERDGDRHASESERQEDSERHESDDVPDQKPIGRRPRTELEGTFDSGERVEVEAVAEVHRATERQEYEQRQAEHV
jgi:hypothetical protein